MLTAAPPLIFLSIPLFVVAMAAEAWSDHRDQTSENYLAIDTATSLTMGLGYVLISLGWKLVDLALYTAVYALAPWELGWTWPVWLLAFVADDLAYYWYHRMHHEVRMFWASHVVHHSSEKYNLSTALRQQWTPVTGFLFWLPLAFLGVHPLLILTAQSWSLLYQFWIHTERIDRMPAWFEAVLNTPSHHRVHHGTNPQYLDKNYGGILIVWDRWFGTFEPEVEQPRYGLTSNVGSYNPLVVAFHEWRAMFADIRRAPSAKDRAGFALQGPGWAYERRRELELEPAS